jgi:VIT1/CCC1 family predicted Fe2+/Mn2+ transporter
MPKLTRKLFSLYLKSFIFGVEDSLVSTIGLISGVAATGATRGVILITGIILIFVEALSMGVGSLLSEHSAQEYEKKKSVSFNTSFLAGVIMFISYFLAGFIPLFSYILWEPADAFWPSIALSLIALFVLGLVSGKILKVKLINKALEMFLLGGLAIVAGVAVGILVQKYLL